MVLKAAVQYARPVIAHKTQVVVVVKNPLCLRLDLLVLDLPCLLFNARKVDSVEEANLDEDSSEKCEVVVVAEAYHAPQRVLLVLRRPKLEQFGNLKLFWY